MSLAFRIEALGDRVENKIYRTLDHGSNIPRELVRAPEANKLSSSIDEICSRVTFCFFLKS